MAALLMTLPQTAQLVLLGDSDQVDSVEAGSVLAELSAAVAKGASANSAWPSCNNAVRIIRKFAQNTPARRAPRAGPQSEMGLPCQGRTVDS